MSEAEPFWLPVEDVIAANRVLVAETGEPFRVRDQGLLESAVAKPRNRYLYGTADMAELAASLLLGIARNHPFAQGNKRTAFASAVMFLELNGYRLVPKADGWLAPIVLQAITGAIADDDLAVLLSEAIEPNDHQ